METEIVKPRNSSLWKQKDGVASIEFAFVLPLLLLILFATVELVNAFDQRRKVNQLGRTLADLFAQGEAQNPMSTSLANDILSAAGPILSPFPQSTATIQVSAVGIYPGQNQALGYVCSVYPPDGERKVGFASDLNLPANFRTPGARVMVVEIKMPYSPILRSTTPGIIQIFNLAAVFDETVYWPVRVGADYNGDSEIVLPAGNKCP